MKELIICGCLVVLSAFITFMPDPREPFTKPEGETMPEQSVCQLVPVYVELQEPYTRPEAQELVAKILDAGREHLTSIANGSQEQRDVVGDEGFWKMFQDATIVKSIPDLSEREEEDEES